MGASRLPFLGRNSVLCAVLHSLVGAPSAEPQGWQTTSGEAMFWLVIVFWWTGVWVQAALFFLLVEAEPEDTTPSLARRLALIVFVTIFAGMRPATASVLL